MENEQLRNVIENLSEEQKKISSHAHYYSLFFAAGARWLFDATWYETLAVLIVAQITQWESAVPLSVQLQNDGSFNQISKSIVGEDMTNILNKTFLMAGLPGRFFSRALHQFPILPEEDKIALKNMFSIR